MQSVEVPSSQRLEYTNVLEALYRLSQELDAKLPMYLVMVKQQDAIKKLIAIVRFFH